MSTASPSHSKIWQLAAPGEASRDVTQSYSSTELIPYSSARWQPSTEWRLLSNSQCTIAHPYIVEAVISARSTFGRTETSIASYSCDNKKRAQTTLSARTASLHSSEAATTYSSQPSRSIPQQCTLIVKNRVRSRWFSIAPTPSAMNTYRGQRGKKATHQEIHENANLLRQ